MKKKQIRLIIAGFQQKSDNAFKAGNIKKADAYEKAVTMMVREYCR